MNIIYSLQAFRRELDDISDTKVEEVTDEDVIIEKIDELIALIAKYEN